MTRAAGLLLHPTSLPGPFAIGDLGPEVDRFLDWAAAAGQSLWQMLPLGPPDAYNSPYSCLSAFAGNPALISPELLVADGLLEPDELDDAPASPAAVDFAAALPWKQRLLRRAWERYRGSVEVSEELEALRRELEAFREDDLQRFWLEDWALFCALRQECGPAWWSWDADLARREPAALDRARRRLGDEVEYHVFVQGLFFRQWQRVRRIAAHRGIRLLGDLPIYVAHDSAEVWARPELFELDATGRPLAVAGVPPDYFSATGQLWGNPLYRWERMTEDGFAWWCRRVEANLRLTDLVRLDHFRGFEAYWRVEAGEPTAEHGRWQPGPGQELFEALRRHLGALPLVAEDLGVITPEVEALRRELGLPGMKVLQFGFHEEDAEHAPHRYEAHTVAYTGTHDNDTAAGWYAGLEPAARRRLQRYGGDDPRPHRLLQRLAYGSVAETAVVPVQDVLGLGSEARMNTPGVASGNWSWRLAPETLDEALAHELRELAALTGRTPPEEEG